MKTKIAVLARISALIGAICCGHGAHAETIQFENRIDMQGARNEYFESGFIFSAGYLLNDQDYPPGVMLANPESSGTLTIRHQDGKPFDFYHLDFRPIVSYPDLKLVFEGETVDGRTVRREVPVSEASKLRRPLGEKSSMAGMVSVTFRTEFRQLRQLKITEGAQFGHIDNVSLTVSPGAAPETANWAQISTEWNSFNVTTTQKVRFGANASWVDRTVTGTGWCTSDFFGMDPTPGVAKVCQAQR